MSEFPYDATGKFVVVTKIKQTETKSGLLFIPEQHSEDESRARVVRVGPKVSDGHIVEGAEVVIEKYDGRKVTIEGVEYTAVPEEEIILVKRS